MSMALKVLGLLFLHVFRSWANDQKPTDISSVHSQSILSQISGNYDCNSNNLLGDFDLKTVTQFNALCNIPIPDIQQTEFLLANNVIPLLCMGLLDVSLRLCKFAKNNVSPFTDIFPPDTDKFNKIFQTLSRSEEFSSSGVFCSSTVKKYTVIKASSNVTEKWWQVLNKQFGDEKSCTNVCHTNEENQVHPLCSYIIWSNGIYINYQKNQVEAKGPATGEDQNTPTKLVLSNSTNKLDHAEQLEHAQQVDHVSGIARNNLPVQVTESVIGPDMVPSEITQGEEIKSIVASENNNAVGLEISEQIQKNEVNTTSNSTTNALAIPTVDQIKPKKNDKSQSNKHHKSKKLQVTGTTSVPTGSAILQNSAPQEGQIEPKVDSNASVATITSGKSEPQGNSAGSASIVPEPQKVAEAKPPEETPKTLEGMVEGDFSFEVTPDGIALDHPIAAGKDFQPPYSDEEGEENGDGDDVDIVESNAQSNTGTVGNQTSVVKAALEQSGLPGIEQGALEGDKVYGEGEILIEDHFIEAEDSHFFTYFLCMAVLTIMAYLAFHNKKKLIALAVEGRRTKGGRRRPNSSHYSKLDCSLEEALVSNTTASVTHVLY